MSVTFDSIVKQMMQNRDKSLSTIDGLKKQITPYATREELKETFDEIIKEDPDYIRRYLKNSSNIAYQTDIYVDSEETKKSLLYRAAFNNDSVYLNFGNGDKILVVCIDSSLASDNYNFYSDVFVNGIKLRKKNYIEVPSTKNYNFKTGARRFFIDEDKVNVGDTISVVIRKEPRTKSFYSTLTITDIKKKTYFIDKTEVGAYGENVDTNDNDITLENLLVFKKSALELDEKFFKLDTNAYVKEYITYFDNLKGTIGKSSYNADIVSLPTKNVKKNDAYKVLVAGTYGKFDCQDGDILFALATKEISDDENWGRIPFNIHKKKLILDLNDENLNKDDIFLVINRKKHIECEFINDSELDIQEYLDYGEAGKYLSIPLVDKSKSVAGCYLPLPVKSIEDVEVYVDGYRLINNLDFLFVNDADSNQYIQFTGILTPGSVVTYRNKNIDNTYNFYTNKNLEKVKDYVLFDDNFKGLLYEKIPNNTDIIVLENISCIFYKNSYDEYKDNFNFVKFIKETNDAKEILENNGIQFYESITDEDGNSYILYEENFGEDEAFEHIDNKFIEFDEYVRSLVVSKKISLNGLVVFDDMIFTKYYDEYEEFKEDMVFIENSSLETNYSYGIIDLCEQIVPISEDYIEAYLGRVRIPVSKKRSIINRYLKIDDQHITLDNAEIYSEINWTDYAKTVIDMIAKPNQIEQNVYSQLHAIDINSELTNNWLKLTNYIGFDSDNGNNTTDDVYYARFKRITFDNALTGQQIKQNIYPSLKVLGIFSDDAAGIDITKYCTYTFKNNHGHELPDFDTTLTGMQYVTAYFNQGSLLETLTDTVAIKVVALQIEHIRIINNTNFFTVGDNILENIRVIGTYENGSEKVINSECDITLANYDGTITYDNGVVDSEGSYIITATHGKITETKTILVDLPSNRRIKHLDVIPNSFLTKENGEEIETIVTSLDIYATYNNGQIQKISNDSVNVYMFDMNEDNVIQDTLKKDVYGENILYDAAGIYGLLLNTEYKFRVYVYNDSTKSGDPIETVTEDYTDVTIKLLSSELTNSHQIIYYDNLTATLNQTFVGMHINDPAYYYYAIKNLDGIYMSWGQNAIDNTEGAMTISSLAVHDVVTVEFYHKDTKEVTNQLLFTVMDVTNNQITSTGILSGSICDGYEIAIDKVALQEDYDNIDFKNAKIRDEDGNVIVRYNVELENENNNYTRNGIDNYFYVYFKNFKTSSGNVNSINQYINESIISGKLTLDLYFEIPALNKTVKLHVPKYDSNGQPTYENSEFEYFKTTQLSISRIYVDDITYEDEKWIIIEPKLPENETIVGVYELRPEASYRTDLTATGSNLTFQLRKRTSIAVGPNAVESDFETTLDILRCGLNRYCYRTSDNDICYIDINVIKHSNLSIAILDTINGEAIKLTDEE